MDEFLKQLDTAKTNATFDPERKAAIRNYLARTIEADALLRDRAKRPAHMFGWRTAFAAAGVLVVFTTSTSFAAQGSLPGDILYSVKVGVTEKVVGALQISTESKAEYETELAIRRIEEAAELSTRGDVSEEAEVQLEDRFVEHAEQAQEHMASVEANGNIKAATNLAVRLEQALEARERLLAKIESKFSERVRREDVSAKEQSSEEDSTGAEAAALMSVELTAPVLAPQTVTATLTSSIDAFAPLAEKKNSPALKAAPRRDIRSGFVVRVRATILRVHDLRTNFEARGKLGVRAPSSQEEDSRTRDAEDDGSGKNNSSSEGVRDDKGGLKTGANPLIGVEGNTSSSKSKDDTSEGDIEVEVRGGVKVDDDDDVSGSGGLDVRIGN